jgi:hypothetical protein
MKHLIVLVIVILAAAVGSTVGQPPPPVTGDVNLEDRNVKGRSIELERVKRDAKKSDANKKELPEPASAAKFAEIKEDFEMLQSAQNEIIAAYTKSKSIEYAKISSNAEIVNRRGTRLKENLFPATLKTQSERAKVQTEKQEIEPLPSDVKSLIVEMDNTLGAFVSNQMFTNPTVVNPAENKKAEIELGKLIRLSTALKTEVDKIAAPK